MHGCVVKYYTEKTFISTDIQWFQLFWRRGEILRIVAIQAEAWCRESKIFKGRLLSFSFFLASMRKVAWKREVWSVVKGVQCPLQTFQFLLLPMDGWIFAFFSALKKNDCKQFATRRPSKQTLVPETLIPEALAYETQTQDSLAPGTRNIGPRNAEPRTTGPRNTETRNTGLRNTGLRNTGSTDTDPRNIGPRNTDPRNTSLWNTGLKNTNLLAPGIDSIAASLFENNWSSWQIVMIVSDDKTQTTLLIPGGGALSSQEHWTQEHWSQKHWSQKNWSQKHWSLKHWSQKHWPKTLTHETLAQGTLDPGTLNPGTLVPGTQEHVGESVSNGMYLRFGHTSHDITFRLPQYMELWTTTHFVWMTNYLCYAGRRILSRASQAVLM